MYTHTFHYGGNATELTLLLAFTVRPPVVKYVLSGVKTTVDMRRALDTLTWSSGVMTCSGLGSADVPHSSAGSVVAGFAADAMLGMRNSVDRRRPRESFRVGSTTPPLGPMAFGSLLTPGRMDLPRAWLAARAAAVYGIADARLAAASAAALGLVFIVVWAVAVQEHRLHGGSAAASAAGLVLPPAPTPPVDSVGALARLCARVLRRLMPPSRSPSFRGCTGRYPSESSDASELDGLGGGLLGFRRNNLAMELRRSVVSFSSAAGTAAGTATVTPLTIATSSFCTVHTLQDSNGT